MNDTVSRSGLLIPPLSGGAVPVAVRLMNALIALCIPLFVHNPISSFQKHAGGDWARLSSSRSVRRAEILDGITELRPSWILALDSDPLDETLIAAIRERSPLTRIGTWFVEDPTTEAGSWWASIAPIVDVFFSIEDGSFLDGVRERGGNARWLPMACDESSFSPPPPGSARRGVHFVGVPRPSRVALFEEWVGRGLPLTLHGPGWSEIPSLAGHAGIREWVNDEQAVEIYRSSLVVADLYDDRPGGYVNPRTFSMMAAGALVVSEHRSDMERLFEPGHVETCPAEEMGERLERLLADPAAVAARGQEAADAVRSRHTFRHRAAEIVRALAPVETRLP